MRRAFALCEVRATLADGGMWEDDDADADADASPSDRLRRRFKFDDSGRCTCAGAGAGEGAGAGACSILRCFFAELQLKGGSGISGEERRGEERKPSGFCSCCSGRFGGRDCSLSAAATIQHLPQAQPTPI